LLGGDHLVEAQRADLVGEYLGQTAVKANELIDSALGGVLFVDEAYSLSNSGPGKGDAYGDAALQVLLQRPAANRDHPAVTLAADNGDVWDEEALDELRSIAGHVVDQQWIDELGNGRFLRTLYEKSCAYRDLRLSTVPGTLTREDLSTLRLPDLMQAYGEVLS